MGHSSVWGKQGERWYKAIAGHVISFCPEEGHLFLALIAFP